MADGGMKLMRRMSSGVMLELARGGIDQPLDQIGRLRPPGAAIGAHRHRVGAHALHVDGIARRSCRGPETRSVERVGTNAPNGDR